MNKQKIWTDQLLFNSKKTEFIVKYLPPKRSSESDGLKNGIYQHVKNN